jgi:hypothetical protein
MFSSRVQNLPPSNAIDIDPKRMPRGSVDKYCVATQYLQGVKVAWVKVPAVIDKDGLDFSESLVNDPSDPDAVLQALSIIEGN